jgi:hypothetical protein
LSPPEVEETLLASGSGPSLLLLNKRDRLHHFKWPISGKSFHSVRVRVFFCAYFLNKKRNRGY